MNYTITPLETAYAGRTFRSRLEARWAVFLDGLGYEWQYEPEGLMLRNGRKYLPDFYTPEFGFIEVKPEVSDESIELVNLVARSTGKPCLLAAGDPGERHLHWAVPGSEFEVVRAPRGSFSADENPTLDEMFDALLGTCQTVKARIVRYCAGILLPVSHKHYPVYFTGETPGTRVDNRFDHDVDLCTARKLALSARFETGNVARPTPPGRYKIDIYHLLTAPLERLDPEMTSSH